ncbi:MAG TPA: flagellar biosynthetic protein FliQ [Acidobacteriota bacterium]|jgi:flagellar biosynthesis protein FliQ|nr:flagellar biosynthetic protein FliQ [Acidobacteriota bacterium]
MNPELAIDLFKSTVLFALYIVAPFLGLLLVVGLIASLFQSITSMQENTLTFAPKLVAMAGLAVLLAPWLLRSLMEFTLAVFAKMPALAH